MTAAIIDVVEYEPEGIAIIEDTEGKYVVTKNDGKITELPNQGCEWFRPERCYLTSGRDRLLT